jgi:hypothetical protein
MSRTTAGNHSSTQCFTSQQHRLELTGRLSGNFSALTPDRVRQILDDYLDDLERELSVSDVATDIGRVQEMLLEIAGFIRSGTARVTGAECQFFLGRLIDIYGNGFSQVGKNAFSVTAADYADVIEAVSIECPAYDYSQAVGQLLCYMQQLFESRKESWITIYEHIESMSDSIAVVQLLKEVYLQEIRQWAEEGAANLFGIESDLLSGIRELAGEIKELEGRIEEKRASLPFGSETAKERGGRQVVDIREKRTEKEIGILFQQIDQLVLERQGKEDIAELIQSNIQELQTKLKETRRRYLLRLV